MPRKNYNILIKKVNETYEGDKIVPYMGNNNLPDPKSTFEYDADRVTIIKKCHSDILFFAENFFYILSQGKKQCITLHDYQKDGLRLFQNNKKNIFNTSRQIGKALALDTVIPTPNGETTMGDIKEGDIVYDNYGNETKVLKAWDIMYGRPCYEVVFDNGEKIIADEDHLWMTDTFNDRRGRSNKTSKDKKTTKDILETLHYKNGKQLQTNHGIKVVEPIKHREQTLDIHPYIMGLWLGDGYSHEPKICVCPRDLQNIKFNLEKIGFHENKNYTVHDFIKQKGHYIISFIGVIPNSDITMRKAIRECDVYCNKHIPEIYLKNSIENRKELLRGLMDTDGSLSNTSCTFYNTNEELVSNFRILLHELGIKHSLKENKYPNYPNGKRGKDCFRVHFKANFEVFKLDRKKEKQHISNIRNNHHYIVDIKKIDSVPVRCITVDSEDAMFLCSKSYIPTSNTTLMTIYALWMTTFFEYRKILVVANKSDTAKEILGRIKMAYEELPNWLKPGVKSWNKQSVEFENGSDIKISATSADAARGQSLNCLSGDSVVDIVDDSGLIFEFTMEELTDLNS